MPQDGQPFDEEEALERPPPEEVFDRIASRTPVDLGASAATLVGDERSSREISQLSEYKFTLIFGGGDILTEDALDALYKAGCDDATFGEIDGSQFGDFKREARSFAEAVAQHGAQSSPPSPAPGSSAWSRGRR